MSRAGCDPVHCSLNHGGSEYTIHMGTRNMLFQVVKMAGWTRRSSRTPPRLWSWCSLVAGIGAFVRGVQLRLAGRSTGHGARMPSLQDLETVPGYAQLKPRISLHRATRVANGLQRVRPGTHPAANDQECRVFSKPPRHRTPESPHRAGCCQRRTAGRVVVQAISGGCGHAAPLPCWAPGTDLPP